MTTRKVQDVVGKKSEHVRVFVRARPLQPGEAAAPLALTERQVTVKTKANSRGQSTYAFKRVFDVDTTQKEVFEQACQPMVAEALKGFSCTIFAYGQTNSGKTHSMMGDLTSHESMGLTPRASRTLFNELMKSQSHYTVRLSCVELYKEEFYDMLADSADSRKKLKLFQDGQRGIVMKGVEEMVVSSPTEVLDKLNAAIHRRQTAATGMNNRSSRSHFIATLSVTIKEETMTGEDLFKIGKLHLVDLAGSESAKRADTTGTDRQSEAAAINKSLLTLGRVISSLSNNESSHTPYRESALTRLLQEALGGKSKTTIITTISLAKANIDETISTLEYASSAKKIENDPEMNRVLSGNQLVSDYESELIRLRTELNDQRNGTGVFISEERYGMMQTRLKELEDDQVVSKDKLGEMQGQLDAAQAELRETVEVMTEKQRRKNVLLGHHQYNETDMAEYIVAGASREDSLRQVIAARDDRETKNFAAVAEATSHQLTSMSDLSDALTSAAQATEHVTQQAIASAQSASATTEAHVKAAAACSEQQHRAVTELQDAAERCRNGFNQAHVQKIGEICEAVEVARGDAVEKVEGLMSTVADGTTALVRTHTDASAASFEDIMQRFLSAASDAAAGDATATSDTVASVMQKYKAEMMEHFQAHAATVEEGVRAGTMAVAAEAQAVVAHAGNTRDGVRGAVTTTKDGVAEGVAGARCALSGGVERTLADFKGDLDTKVTRHHEMLVVLEEREKAAAELAGEQRAKLHAEATQMQQAAMQEIAQVMHRMNNELQALQTRNADVERDLRTTVQQINVDRVRAQTALHTDLAATHASVKHALQASLDANTQAGDALMKDVAAQMDNVLNTVVAHAQHTGERMATAEAACGQLRDGTSGANKASADALVQRCDGVDTAARTAVTELVGGQKRKRVDDATNVSSAVKQALANALAELARSRDAFAATCMEQAGGAQQSLAEGARGVQTRVKEASEMSLSAISQVVERVQGGAAASAEGAKGVRAQLGQCRTAAQLYPQVVEGGMTEGAAEIMAGVHAASCVLQRLREDVEFLTTSTQPHQRGMTPSPARRVPETTVDYPAILAAFDADMAAAADTPQPKRHKIHDLAARKNAAAAGPQHVDPVHMQAPPATPTTARVVKTVDGTPKTPLTARSGNIAM